MGKFKRGETIVKVGACLCEYCAPSEVVTVVTTDSGTTVVKDSYGNYFGIKEADRNLWEASKQVDKTLNVKEELAVEVFELFEEQAWGIVNPESRDNTDSLLFASLLYGIEEANRRTQDEVLLRYFGELDDIYNARR